MEMHYTTLYIEVYYLEERFRTLRLAVRLGRNPAVTRLRKILES